MNLKWIEDKTQNFRGNFKSMCFKLDNSKYIFCFNSYMSYKTFKPMVRKVAEQFNSHIVEILEDTEQSNMIISCWEDNIKFFIELNVEEGQKRRFKFFTVNEIFNN